ncbi:MAG: hypothetical protein COB56_03410 [Robiginitomaculum sp.]|nr:MAG: hypothetical protein COB56_03410 [Robiginitomaculum sp.]
MSETSNLASNNIEPSMEDILSSIRKVIAEDLSQKETDEVQAKVETKSQIKTTAPEEVEQPTDQQAPVDAPRDDVLDLDILLGDIDPAEGDIDEVMELIQLEDDSVETPAPEQKQATEQAADAGFDETLDLVMDADASDFATESFEPIADAPRVETVKTPTTALADDGPIANIIEEVLFDEQNDASSGAITDLATNTAGEETPIAIELAQEPKPSRKPVQASANDDMDLVKSLLEDLMDEPAAETISASVETAVAEVAFDIEDSFSDNDLLIPDPEALKIEAEPSPAPDVEMEAPNQVEAHTPFDDTESPEPDNEFENELAQLAREIAEVREITTDDMPAADDVVELSTPDYASKLAISASLTAGAASVEENTTDIIAAAEDDLESLQQLIAEPELAASTQGKIEIPEEIAALIPPLQEDETMATPLKNDVLSGADTQLEAGNAFASLTSTVQKQAVTEENGPPIGELVKEALKPMLQEWLDKNLKTMVQRAVTKEIKRISTGK